MTKRRIWGNREPIARAVLFVGSWPLPLGDFSTTMLSYVTHNSEETSDNASSQFAYQAISRVVRTVAERRGDIIRKTVAETRERYPTYAKEELANFFIRRRAFYSGVSGGLTSLGGLVTLPFTLPAGLLSSLVFQAEIMLTVAHIYGHDLEHEDRYLDLLLLFLGNSVHEVMKRLGIAAGQRLTRSMVQRVFTREIMYAIWRVVGKEVLTKAGTKSTFSLMRAVPLVAAPIGFAFDYAAARALGKAAILFYGHEDELHLENLDGDGTEADSAPTAGPA